MAREIATYTFPRGIHPREGKELSEKCSIEILPTPELLKISLSQHIGAPAKLCVKQRDTLEAGQLVGEAGGFVSAAIYTPLPGTVKRIGAVTLPNGRRAPAVIQNVDVEKAAAVTKELFEKLTHFSDYSLADYTSEEILAKIRNAGLVGEGGAAFPTHVKLTPNPEKPIDTLLINGCECEPYLTADHRVMLEMTDAVLAGVRFAAKAVGAKKIMFCIEANKPDAIETVAKAVEALKKEAGEPEIEVARMKTKYPQGGEKQLIYAALRRKVPLGKLPMDIGAAVVNVGTSASIAMAVRYDAPLTHRVVTVTGGGIKRPANLFVPIGTPVNVLVDYCGKMLPNARRILLGGPMMGFAIGSPDIPVTKGTSGITILSAQEVDRAKQTNCIRCGRCVSACPMHLIPTRLILAARAKNWDSFKEYHPMACIECGCCSFSCPAKIPIVQMIRVGKMELARQRQAEQKKNS